RRRLRPRSLLAFAIRDQRELADGKLGAPGVDDAPIELPLVVLEDPKPRDAARQIVRSGRVIDGADAEEHEQAGPDLPDHAAAHAHARLRDALDDRPQPSRSLIREAYRRLCGRSELAGL